MDEVFRGWLYKIGISLIPVFFPVASVLIFVSIRPEPFQQAAGNALYLFVLLAAENISLSLDRDQSAGSSRAAEPAFYTIMATLLWAGLSLIGLSFVPLSLVNYIQLSAIMVVGLLFGIQISRTNYRLYGLDYTKKQKQQEEELEKRVSKDPGNKAEVGDNSFEI
jgi:hypothetical protein